ncbi:MAG: hypothetical protein F4X48_03675 [Acidimicrobiia bacterium]|nr:hypothetical protein [Acidimicrobiia bacterium]MYC57673.1 hypothetical protein [Acidimicrobiia bacterium]
MNMSEVQAREYTESTTLMLGQIEVDLTDVEAVLADLDDLDALRHRIAAAQADGSIADRAALVACAKWLSDNQGEPD